MHPEPREATRRRSQPKQPRSQETFNSIVEATARLLAERGYEEASTHAIAKEAGISVGALYRYFADKQEICMELYRREMSELRTKLLSQLDITDLFASDLRQILRHTLTSAFRIYGERAALRRVLSEQSRKIEALGELRRTQEAEVHAAVLKILRSVTGVQLPDPEASAYLLTLFVETLVDECVLYRGAPPVLAEERLVNAAVDLILRYGLGKTD